MARRVVMSCQHRADCAISGPTARLPLHRTRQEISMIRHNSHQLPKGQMLVSIALLAAGLVASVIATPAVGHSPAGSPGTCEGTGNLNTARDFHSATLTE